MYINRKIYIRGSYTYIDNDYFKNNLSKKERRGLTNSLSMNNIYLLPQSTRQFGKELRNTMNLTVNPDSIQQNISIEEKIKYYKKINDDLTNMLNNYDKNFFANNNNKMIQKIININGKENDKLIHKSTEKYLIPFTRNDKKRYDKIIADKENKENKENTDNEKNKNDIIIEKLEEE